MTLYLVGTNHLDLKGPSRLEKMLGILHPECIGVESDEVSYAARLKEHILQEKEFKDNVIDFVFAMGLEGYEKISRFFLKQAYEIWVCENYRQLNPSTKLFYCDSSSELRSKEVREQIFGDFLNTDGVATNELITQLLAADFDEFQRLFDENYDNPSVENLCTKSLTFDELIVQRDGFVEGKLREAVQKEAGKFNNFVYIGGYVHFFGNYPNLYARLSDLNPTRIKLKDADKF